MNFGQEDIDDLATQKTRHKTYERAGKLVAAFIFCLGLWVLIMFFCLGIAGIIKLFGEV